MVRELEKVSGQKHINKDFPAHASTAHPVFYRTYSRRTENGRETWTDVCDRTMAGLEKLGKLSKAEKDLIYKMQREIKSLTSGRWLWVGGTEWIENPANFSGAYNCSSTNITDWRAFGLLMDLAMMGCGTGAVLEPRYINQLPPIKNTINVTIAKEIGLVPAGDRQTETTTTINDQQVLMIVGDSRQGWVQSYQTLLELSTDQRFNGAVDLQVDLSHVRPAGEKLKGFGGVANPVKLTELYVRCSAILNKAIGRQLNSVECCLLIDEAAVTIVAGNIRRCLPAGSLVHTSFGLVPIEKIRIGDRVLTSKGFYPVTNFFDQGEQSLCRITTQDGYLECTADHKVAVLEDVYGNYRMVKAQDLQPGDRLIFVPQAIAGNATELPEFKATDLHNNTTPITIPALTSDVAYFIGYLHGDGSIASDGSRVRFRVAENHAKILDKLIHVGYLFGLEKYTLRTPEQCQAKAFELQFNSSALNKYLAQFKKPFTSITIPDCILMGTEEIRQAYLAGLADADDYHSQGVLVASVYPDFLRQVQTLYASLGITTRLCSSIRKRNNKWEGELVTVGEKAFIAVETIMLAHSLEFANNRRSQPISFKDHGFPKEMVRPLVNTYQYHWSDHQQQMIVPTVKKHIPTATDLIPVKVEQVTMNVRTAHTYDIEVASIHEFVCEGILVSNSAGMRQGISDDHLFAGAKENLWQQDAEGNWRIDPERDSLRMANHTRVFHTKPDREESITAVRKQFYSGEGAIQWAGEAVARANSDLLNTPALKTEFLHAYAEGQGENWLKTKYPHLDAEELAHRIARIGLNPCVTAHTWVHTEYGPRQVKDLIGQQHGTYINGELFSTTAEGFFYSGTKPVVKLVTEEGYTLRLTKNHRLLKVNAQTQKKQYLDWVETENLQVGDRILLHNHRDISAWSGHGTEEEGWLIGNLVGDGSLTKTAWNDTAVLRYWEKTQDAMSEYAVSLLETAVGYKPTTSEAFYHKQLKHRVITSSGLAKLAAQFGIIPGDKHLKPAIEETSYQFYQGFLRGFFDADGSVQGTQAKGVSIRLPQSNLETLQVVQRMLARLGIISTIYENRRPAGYRLLPDTDRQPAEYYCQAQHELVISRDNLVYFQQIVGFTDPVKAEKLTSILANYKRGIYRERFAVTIASIESDGIEPVYDCTVPGPNCFDANGLVAHNCGEIIGANFHCNLSEVHLNQLDPRNEKEQAEAFQAAALSVAVLLNHQFVEPRYHYSRQLDPIVGVSFTGLFDFFVNALGVEWLKWWETGRPATVAGLEFKEKEAEYLNRWQEIVHQTVWDYCDRHGLKRPNRCTTVQPSGTKSLLTGASPGWHPPKAQRFIRRITFRKNDPVALACIDYGYSVIPSQSDKDENGHLLNDPYDPRCTEWLIEIPVAVNWADLPGADQIDISQFNAIAQFDFYMQVQKYYTRHNTSATIELRENEIEALGDRIYQAIRDDEGYISAALLARFDDHQAFPRLPFEPISRQEYDQMMQDVLKRRQTDHFHTALMRYDLGEMPEAGPAGCDSDKCLLPEQTPNS